MIIKLGVHCILLFSYVTDLSYGFNVLTLNNSKDVTKYFDTNERAKDYSNKILFIKAPKDYHSPERLLKKYTNLYNNKVLVKRIIPRFLKPTGLEYDYKYGTLYKPLVRFHKQKQQSSFEDNDENIVSYIIKNEPKLKHFKLNKVDNIDQELLAPFKMSQLENEIVALRKIQKILRNIDSRTSRLKAYDKVIKVINSMLRTNTQFEKSGEDNDPLAPGKLIFTEEKEEVTEKQKVWMPHYPAWNFWTVSLVLIYR